MPGTADRSAEQRIFDAPIFGDRHSRRNPAHAGAIRRKSRSRAAITFQVSTIFAPDVIGPAVGGADLDRRRLLGPVKVLWRDPSKT
jgi:hypothetical protein